MSREARLLFKSAFLLNKRGVFGAFVVVFWRFVGDSLEICWGLVGDLLDGFVGDLLETCWILVGDGWRLVGHVTCYTCWTCWTCWRLVGDLLDTGWRFTGVAAGPFFPVLPGGRGGFQPCSGVGFLQA